MLSELVKRSLAIPKVSRLQHLLRIAQQFFDKVDNQTGFGRRSLAVGSTAIGTEGAPERQGQEVISMERWARRRTTP